MYAVVPIHSVQLAPTQLTTARLALAQMALLPIVPILLLPFIVVAFVVVFPLWALSLAVLWLLRALVWPVDRVLGRAESERVAAPLERATRWLTTFGGLTERYAAANPPPDRSSHS